MAQGGAQAEGPQWAAAGIVDGATVADIGCGPGAVTAVLARLVGPAGRVLAVDQDPRTVEVARAWMQRERLAELQVRRRIRDDVDSGAQKQQREYFLRKQMESIRKELGEDEEDLIGEYERKIAEA